MYIIYLNKETSFFETGKVPLFSELMSETSNCIVKPTSIRKVLRTNDDVGRIKKTSLHIISKCCELIINDLMNECNNYMILNNINNKNKRIKSIDQDTLIHIATDNDKVKFMNLTNDYSRCQNIVDHVDDNKIHDSNSVPEMENVNNENKDETEREGTKKKKKKMKQSGDKKRKMENNDDMEPDKKKQKRNGEDKKKNMFNFENVFGSW